MLPNGEDFSNFSSDDLSYTVSFSKISCWYPMYYGHIIFCYLIVFSAIGCFVTRLHPILMPGHVWCGRAYIISMLWSTATSMLIHNTGLPVGVLFSFMWVLGGMTVAWILILVHRDMMDKKAFERVAKKIAKGVLVLKEGESLETIVKKEKGAIAEEKTLLQRIFSLKAAHGALMFMSFMNIFGRIFASDQSGDFTCHTYPYYKAAYTESGLPEPVEIVNEAYYNLPWGRLGLTGWAAALSLGPLLAALIFGLIWAAIAIQMRKMREAGTKDSPQVAADASDSKESKEDPKQIELTEMKQSS